MSCSASSARPPLTITGRSYRARAHSALPPLRPPSPPSTSTDYDDDDDDDDDDEEDDDSHAHFVSRSPSPLPTSTRRPILPPMLASFFAFVPSKKERGVYALAASQDPSVDSLSLPVPASPQRASFGAEVWKEDGHFRTGGRPLPRETLPWWSASFSRMAPMLFIAIICPLSTALVLAGIFSLPITASFPRNLSELSDLARQLQAYSDSGLRPMAHVLGVLSFTALWKHAWSVPGSVLLNVLAGVLMSPVTSTLLMTFITALGSVLSSLLSTPLTPVISQFSPKALALTRHALEGGDVLTTPSKDRTPRWVRLSVLRLIGVVPWSGINIACGVTGVPLSDCFIGAFIGTLPWTAVTCQIGDIMQTVATASTSSEDSETLTSLLRSPTVVLKLALLTFLSLVPILARDRLRSLLGRSMEEDAAQLDCKVVRDAKGQRWWWRARRKAGGALEMEVQPAPSEKHSHR